MTETKQFPPTSLIIGSPARVVRELTTAEQQVTAMNASHYVRNATRFRKSLEHLHPDHPGTTARGVGNAGHPG